MAGATTKIIQPSGLLGLLLLGTALCGCRLDPPPTATQGTQKDLAGGYALIDGNLPQCALTPAQENAAAAQEGGPAQLVESASQRVVLMEKQRKLLPCSDAQFALAAAQQNSRESKQMELETAKVVRCPESPAYIYCESKGARSGREPEWICVSSKGQETLPSLPDCRQPLTDPENGDR